MAVRVGYVQSSPAVANNAVYVGSFNNSIYAFDTLSGALLWQYSTGASVYSSLAVANGVVYVGSYDSNLYALNADTGALLWTYLTGNQVASSPAVGVVRRKSHRSSWVPRMAAFTLLG